MCVQCQYRHRSLVVVPHPAPAYVALCRTRRLPTWPCAAPGACLHGLVPAYMALCRTRRLPTGTWAYRYLGVCSTRCLPTTTTYYYHEPACLAYLAYLNYLALSPLASALGILLSN